MKKIILVLTSFVLIMILTGCGKETLTCTMSSEESGMKMDQKVVADFVNNNVSDMKLDIDVLIPDDYKEYIDTFKSAFVQEYKEYENNGADVDINADGNTISIDIVFDVKNMTKEQKENLDMTNTFGTKKATLKDFESKGYTCK